MESTALNATTTTTTTTAPNVTTTTTPTTMNATAMPTGDDWLCHVDGTARRSSAAKKMAKMRRVKLNQICNAGNVKQQAAVLHAVIDHRDLAAAHELAGIDSTKEMAATKYVCEQSARMLGRACSSKNA